MDRQIFLKISSNKPHIAYYSTNQATEIQDQYCIELSDDR